MTELFWKEGEREDQGSKVSERGKGASQEEKRGTHPTEVGAGLASWGNSEVANVASAVSKGAISGG